MTGTLALKLKPLLINELGATFTNLLLIENEPMASSYYNANTIQWMQLSADAGKTEENIVSTTHYCENRDERLIFYLKMGLGR